jgi:hypothetical protein
LAIDPFTANDTIIIHYLINKNQILDLANNLTTKNGYNNATATDNSTSTVAVNDNKSISVGNMRGTPDSRINYMQFSLMPITGNTTQSTSSDLTTDTGGIHATVTWEPKQLKAGRQSTVHINFSDAFSGEPLLANVLYNMSILDSNGTEVLRMDNLTAINATDSRVVSFPADAIYQIEVNVKGIIRDDQGSPDTTRSGIARGYVVVPEFSSPSSSLVVAGVIISALIFVARYHGGKRKYLSNE